ncbi:MAG TPA: biotin--[acetyl-CoA-carboxylase] ligase [Acidobacteriaceae bacterium]|nr:biotin--[acetyl-CoA-carboxylase] ligase [Acidobacteriaceae bacterium]
MPPQTTTPDPPTFNLSALNTALAATPFAGHLHHLASTSSTNDLAAQAALAGSRTGVWIADHQLAGRGRGRHTWHSPAGSGLYMTALTAPPIAMQSAPAISLRVAIAVQSAIASLYGFARPHQIDIRWPNDLLLNRRKVGGILIDTASNPATATHPATLRYAIVGIGINLNQASFPPDLEPIATSIRRELSTQSIENSTNCPREPLAAAILLALEQELHDLTQTPAPTPLDLAPYSTWITNKRVRVEPREGLPVYTGTTAGLNPAGFLLVQGDDGQLHTVLSGGLREP